MLCNCPVRKVWALHCILLTDKHAGNLKLLAVCKRSLFLRVKELIFHEKV